MAKDLDAVNAVLLTDNYTKSKLDSLRQIYSDIKQLDYSQNQEILPDSVYVDSLFILGNGVAPYDFWQLEKTQVQFLKGSDLKGITKLKYANQLNVGEELLVSAQYQSGEKGNFLLLLGPANQVLDSLMLQGKKVQHINLKSNLDVAGTFIYQLIEKDEEGRELNKNPLPLKVVEVDPLQVLIVNAFPTFETKYLKNFLADNGHKVVSRIQLTKGRFKFEYFNIPKSPINTLTSEVLGQFDLVIMDYRSLINLSRSDRSTLTIAIQEQGLGLFIQPDREVFSSNNNLIPFNYDYDATIRTLRDTINALNYSKFPYKIKSRNTIVPIHQIGDEIISAYKRNGLGKVGGSVLSNTFELLLEGKEKIYHSLWSEIITVIGKHQGLSTEWEFDSPFIYLNEPNHFKLRTRIEDPILKSNLGYTVSLRRDINIPELWYGTTYPTSTGWQAFGIDSDSTAIYDYYVFGENQWASLKYANRIAENQRHFNEKLSLENVSGTSLKPVDLLWMYILVLLGLGYLWLAPKLAFHHF